ncbi:hypothetical protein Caci_6653 [Catenulispora acidiphila DSM 44928]|uniref:Uncharacterized protein n=1 Tax=Catenulispora acidiphila (strain DSM 44928 / JCM 14897 / NBRC 102108 / NRRL B-24433 / ID139908) TaxID=479433 RepID=C7Q006_CATAD|nr:hypothetical protein [Catenulispora acidiphila]ACU75499.1 hypothetical protein Caci_6653 [Catenulispora acidiphila DSM 44928]
MHTIFDRSAMREVRAFSAIVCGVDAPNFAVTVCPADAKLGL